jgi:hypothetical protein
MKRIAILSIVASIITSQPSLGRSDAEMRAEIERLCQRVLCRKPSPIRLQLPAGEVFEMTPTSPTPIVAGDLVTVYPGETIRIEAKVEADRLVGLTAVPEINHPERTLVFRLKQEPKIGDGTGMLLEVESPFAGVLKYRLGMMLPTGENLLKTSACPLHAGKTVVEHWPHPIFQIVATDFRLVDPESTAASTCE